MLELTQEQRAAVAHAVRYYIAEAAEWSSRRNVLAETLKPILAELEKPSEPYNSLLLFVPGKQPPQADGLCGRCAGTGVVGLTKARCPVCQGFGYKAYDQHGRYVG